jgi:hypothetical protein
LIQIKELIERVQDDPLVVGVCRRHLAAEEEEHENDADADADGDGEVDEEED